MNIHAFLFSDVFANAVKFPENTAFDTSRCLGILIAMAVLIHYLPHALRNPVITWLLIFTLAS